MKEVLRFSIHETERVLTVAKALASEQRLAVLKLLEREELNVSEIAERLGIPISSAALHVRVLEEAGLVTTQPVPGQRGLQKRSSAKVEQLILDLAASDPEQFPYRTMYYSIPIGNYFDFSVSAPCGIATESGILSTDEDSRSFFLAEHSQAQMIWFKRGYLEYRIDATQMKAAREVERVEFSFEVCGPSEIALWINGAEVGAFPGTAEPGFGRGQQNPLWWPDSMPQYGRLHTLSVRRDGCYVDEVSTCRENLMSLAHRSTGSILLRIGTKDGADGSGGMSLFGEHFGNLSQHINVKVNYIPI